MTTKTPPPTEPPDEPPIDDSWIPDGEREDQVLPYKRPSKEYNPMVENTEGILPGHVYKRLETSMDKAQIAIMMIGLIYPPKKAAEFLGITRRRLRSTMKLARRIEPDLRKIRDSAIVAMAKRKQLQGLVSLDMDEVAHDKRADSILKLEKVVDLIERNEPVTADSKEDVLEIIMRLKCSNQPSPVLDVTDSVEVADGKGGNKADDSPATRP